MSIERNIFDYMSAADVAKVKGDGDANLDSSVAFNKMFADLKSGDSFIATGTFFLAADIELPKKLSLIKGRINGKMYRKRGSTASIKLTDLSLCDIYINQFSAIEVISQAGPLTGIGLDIRGNSYSKIEIGYVSGFEHNIYLSTTETNGSLGNKISWKSSILSKFCFKMATDSSETGKVKAYNNGNIIYGGHMQGDTCFVMVPRRNAQGVIDPDFDWFNGNQLMSGLFEGGTTALSIDGAKFNEFHGRIESGKFQKVLVTTENCKGNQYFITAYRKQCQINGISERFYGNILGDTGDAIGQYVYTDNQKQLHTIPS